VREEAPTTASGLRVTTSLEDGMISARLEPLQGDLAVLNLHFRLNYDETLFFGGFMEPNRSRCR
jgi:hypothetical protein